MTRRAPGPRSGAPSLILASASSARRRLLRQIGLRARVVVPRVEEERGASGCDCRRLVTANALLKARDVAARCRRGVVIAADTVVEAGGKIVGKPRDLADARAMLAEISRLPQRVYTGVAVVDAASGRALTACERTTVRMTPLGKRDIERYFNKVSPLDKAGGFDIGGYGALFVRRVEGCVSNVIGLPLARLALLLARLGVEL